MAQIKSIKAFEILDSRGIPTLETEVFLDDGSKARSSVPAGFSKGSFEAVELRDDDPARFKGMGVKKAAAIVNEKIAPALNGRQAEYQSKIDQALIELDQTSNKKNLGANSILSVSQAVAKAAASSYQMALFDYLQSKYQLADKSSSFPLPIFNLINGGQHGAGNLDFQEFHIIPSSRFNFGKSLEIGAEVYQTLKTILVERKSIHSVGDDGGFAPNLFTNMDALEIIKEAVSRTNYQFNSDVFFGLDVAASQFYKGGKYFIKDRAQAFSKENFIKYYEELNKQYHILLLEDPLHEDDWDGWKELLSLLGSKVIILGDDLLCTNIDRVKKAITKEACNGILIKPNQIGTITETIAVIKACREAGWQIVVSHRGGETNDDFIADFAVGVGANYVKFGAPARGERVAKYNRLLEIAREIKD